MVVVVATVLQVIYFCFVRKNFQTSKILYIFHNGFEGVKWTLQSELQKSEPILIAICPKVCEIVGLGIINRVNYHSGILPHTKGGLKSESAGGFSIAQTICRKAILKFYILYMELTKCNLSFFCIYKLIIFSSFTNRF